MNTEGPYCVRYDGALPFSVRVALGGRRGLVARGRVPVRAQTGGGLKEEVGDGFDCGSRQGREQYAKGHPEQANYF